MTLKTDRNLGKFGGTAPAGKHPLEVLLQKQLMREAVRAGKPASSVPSLEELAKKG